MAMRVKYELIICERCAYLFTNGEYNDGTDFAEVATAHAVQKWGDELRELCVGDAVEGYSPIYTCALDGEEHEGHGQHTAVILESV